MLGAKQRRLLVEPSRHNGVKKREGKKRKKRRIDIANEIGPPADLSAMAYAKGKTHHPKNQWGDERQPNWV